MADQQLLDTNVLIRFFTGEPPAQAQQAHSLITEADSGKIILVILPVIIAETVFTLQSFYKLKPKDIAARIMLFIQSQGILMKEKSRILNALQRYGDGKAGFIDAYLAAVATEEGLPIASFDRDFDKFKDISRIEPNTR